ncbi:MAG: winged helix-turn-helix domain-containing protein [Hyphomicrobiales bacterium]|nr:winged helix-turn-helix domain-containing protein [Hyphomicrobiales bacterium]MBV8662726.1 winged helix-turn-helix domain-containing protein [Hyphomicrobiales bacterium]
MPLGRRPIYESGPWEIDFGRRELRARGLPIPLGSRAFEILEVLVRSAGELVTKDDLIGRVWGGAVVEENTLQVHISAVRKALGSDRGLLATSSGRGYRLLGSWTVRQERASADPIAPELAPTPIRPPLTNIPVAASELIGRETVAHHLRDLLSAYRVVTLTGPGGIGKTVLALEVARSLLPTFQGDAWLIELASLSDPALLPSMVAGDLGLKLGGDKIFSETVARAIGGKKLLLVLDNCEHVIDAAAEFAETLVGLCAHATILATSREGLRIEGEQVYRVAPLDVPPQQQEEPAGVLAHSAAQLFVARLRTLGASVSLHGDDLPMIATICRRLDGIPLAIEFAAARAAGLGLSLVTARLDDRFALLTSGRRTALARHQTLRATLDWSYELLPEPEQRLLRQLAVFPAGFTLEAAMAVMNGTSNAGSTVAERVASLVEKSLVILDSSPTAARWRLLETIRAYALEKLNENGEAEQAGRRHAEFFRDLIAAADARSPLLPGIEKLTRCCREIDNVRAALDWSFSPAGDPAIGVILTAAYVPAWMHFALLVECRERTERALGSLAPDLSQNVALRMQLQLALGVTRMFTIEPVESSRAILVDALELAESLGDVEAQLQALWALWIIHTEIGDCRVAQSTAERLSHLAGRTGDLATVLFADRLVGSALHYGGELRKARRCFERVLELYVAPRDERHTFWLHFDSRVLARTMLARVLLLQGLADQAAVQARASLEEAQAKDYELSICEVLCLAAYPIALMTGDLISAEKAVTTLNSLAKRHNSTGYMSWGRCLEGTLLIKRGEFERGVVLLRGAVDASDDTEWGGYVHNLALGAIAEGLARLGQLTKALATIERSLARAERGGMRWYVAELVRIKGELLLEQGEDGSVSAAEDCFCEALEVARQQAALFWELRSALSLARLRVKQDRPDDARQVVAPVYNRFTEGFGTADLREARAILELLPPQISDRPA